MAPYYLDLKSQTPYPGIRAVIIPAWSGLNTLPQSTAHAMHMVIHLRLQCSFHTEGPLAPGSSLPPGCEHHGDSGLDKGRTLLLRGRTCSAGREVRQVCPEMVKSLLPSIRGLKCDWQGDCRGKVRLPTSSPTVMSQSPTVGGGCGTQIL